MVARSWVPKARRTSGSVAIMRLTDESSSARDFSTDEYAWKLFRTSSSRLSDTAWRMCRSTICPVMANSTVSATEVESRILVSSGSREKRRRILFPSSGIGAVVGDRRVGMAVLVEVGGRNVAGLGDRDQREGQ